MNLRTHIAICLACLTCVNLAHAQTPEFPPSRHTVARSELRILPLAVDGLQYQLHVGLPMSYAKNLQKRYPVVYVTDAYWDFTKIFTSENELVFDKKVPEYITVGLGYAGDKFNVHALRQRDLLPMPLPQMGSNTGHAAQFLQMLETQAIALVDREYRTDPNHRVLAGASFGGLFTLYAMLTKPQLFQGYIAATPSVMSGNDWLFDYEDAFAKSGQTIKGRLFMAVGEDEYVKHVRSIEQFDKRLRSRKYPGLDYTFRVIDGQSHAGMQQEAYVRGLTYTFAPYKP